MLCIYICRGAAGVVDDSELPPVVTEPAKANWWGDFFPGAAAVVGIPRNASAIVQRSHVVVPARFEILSGFKRVWTPVGGLGTNFSRSTELQMNENDFIENYAVF